MRSSSPLSKLYKFSDDSALTDFSETAEQFEKQVLELCVWCKNNYLELNVSKTKEMIIESNYRRSKKCVVDMDDDSSELMCSMYSDDLILEDSSESEDQFDKFVQSVNSWCKNSQLELETEKIKRAKWCDKVNELKIDGKTVERVSEQKYLGTIIDDKLTFDSNTAAILKKCNQRLFCLYKLRSFDVNSKTMQLFFNAFIQSALTSSFLCWFGNLAVKNRTKLNSIVNRCSKVVGVRQEGMNEVYERRVRKKARAIMNEDSHPLAVHYQ